MQKSPHSRSVIIRRWITVAALATFCIIVDQFTKATFLKTPHFFLRPLIEPILHLVHHKNYGIIANIPIPQTIIITLTIIVLFVLFLTLNKHIRDRNHFRILSITLIIAGAIGNLIDRLSYGYVFDWILLFQRSAINIADIFITVGIVFFAYSTIRSRHSIPPRSHPQEQIIAN